MRKKRAYRDQDEAERKALMLIQTLMGTSKRLCIAGLGASNSLFMAAKREAMTPDFVKHASKAIYYFVKANRERKDSKVLYENCMKVANELKKLGV